MNQENSWRTEEEGVSANELSAIEKFRTTHPTAPVTEAAMEKTPVPRTYLALVGAGCEEYGIVEDTMGDIMWVPGKGELVGTFSRAKYDNMIHVSLMTSIQALQDRSTITWKKYAEERIAQKAGKKPRKARAAHEKEEVVEQVLELSVETQLEFNSLRARLKRKK